MGRLLVFNPEHDYALAKGSPFYEAPKSVKALGRLLQLLPRIWALDEDWILLADNRAISASGSRMATDFGTSIDSVEPWGWDEAIRHRLVRLGVNPSALPSKDFLDNVRRLSHRRISIAANSFLRAPFVPEEFSDVEEALQFAANHPGCFFKMPWSSGGRGVVATAELNPAQIREWVSGCIRKQGSVLAEPRVERRLDFASLWHITSDGNPVFEGFSVSRSDGRGKYHGNLVGQQSGLESYIAQFTSTLPWDFVEAQKEFLSLHIAPFYAGKLGFDMMADYKGTVYPCVELNLRRTMGHVALDFSKLSERQMALLDIRNLPLFPSPTPPTLTTPTTSF